MTEATRAATSSMWNAIDEAKKACGAGIVPIGKVNGKYDVEFHGDKLDFTIVKNAGSVSARNAVQRVGLLCSMKKDFFEKECKGHEAGVYPAIQGTVKTEKVGTMFLQDRESCRIPDDRLGLIRQFEVTIDGYTRNPKRFRAVYVNNDIWPRGSIDTIESDADTFKRWYNEETESHRRLGPVKKETTAITTNLDAYDTIIAYSSPIGVQKGTHAPDPVDVNEVTERLIA